MLTDTALRNLKPKSKIYKAFDRNGMYVTVSPAGTIIFRFDYRLTGRRDHRPLRAGGYFAGTGPRKADRRQEGRRSR